MFDHLHQIGCHGAARVVLRPEGAVRALVVREPSPLRVVLALLDDEAESARVEVHAKLPHLALRRGKPIVEPDTVPVPLVM